MKLFLPNVFLVSVITSICMEGLFGCNPAPTKVSETTSEKQHEKSTMLNQYQYTQLHLGVQVRIVVFAENEATSNNAARAAFGRMAVLEDVFSNYRPHSELSRLSTRAYNKPAKVSNELFYVIQSSLSFSQETQGAFDITLGPLILLWKNARLTKTLPPPDVIERARKVSGWRHLLLNKADQTVFLDAPEMKLDAGGIAKGYILDEALKVLSEAGVSQALIEAGGDIVVSNAPPGKAGWDIEVANAPPTSSIAQKASTLSNAAIATSGDTEQYVIINGVQYSHIINPQTGLGATTRIMATVIAPNGITADKFATALTVMEKPAADALLNAHPEVFAFVR